MSSEIPSRFDYANAEPRLYAMWEQGGFFHARPRPDRKPFCMVIPPPNVTGALHLGHALNNTLQDVLVRLKRMQGFETLWMPGTDHAGIATQARVEKRLRQEENLSRHDLGREKLVERIWQWKDQYENRILSQLKQMGCSCDWERTRFTLDDRCARAVRTTFFDLFRQDRIYRGKRLVNWDPFLQTAVSDDEVNNETVQGSFWHLRYPVMDPKPGEPQFVVVATTRPETMLGDTAVAVHPDPAAAFQKIEAELREKKQAAKGAEAESAAQALEALEERRGAMLLPLQQLAAMAADGRMIRLPLLDRTIPLIADAWAKPELGSGCVKITPAHDPNDYEVGKRADLPMINILNPDGTLNAEAGPYDGLAIKAARKQVVQDLEALDLVEKIEQRQIELPLSDRSKEPIEPMLADQWFVRMDALAQSAMDAVETNAVRIVPPRYASGYLAWLAEKRDWPVSRQLWWGHQIPVWSKPLESSDEIDEARRELEEGLNINGSTAAFQIETSEEPDAEKRQRLGLPAATVHVCVRTEGDPLEAILERSGYTRVEDVLDTWFSSALWPHSTLGWPDKTDELNYFYPTNTLITSRDIITLWVARMVLMGLNNTGQVPFDRVYIHPKILDGDGETMSKSKGNGIDPLDIISRFGADALRFGMTHLATETQDVRMPVQFECPECEAKIDLTRKNRELARIPCPQCGKDFGTQWAESGVDAELPRGAVISERFETARNFTNKLWNAFRFAMMNLEDFTAGPVMEDELALEDRWMLGRLESVTESVTQQLESFRFADAARDLYELAWQDFCSSYLEILKDRFANSEQRSAAQRMLVHCLDHLMRLLHPTMPFITEEIWQRLGTIAPQRGFPHAETAPGCLIEAAWPEITDRYRSAETEARFGLFQKALTAVRDIRSKQNVPPKTQVSFAIRCDARQADALQPLLGYFESLANARCTAAGSDIAVPPFAAVVTVEQLDIIVDLADLIDFDAERKRLNKEIEKTEKSIAGKEGKLANEKFVSNAPADIIQRERDSLDQLKESLAALQDRLQCLPDTTSSAG